MQNMDKQTDTIDLKKIIKLLWDKRKLYIYVMAGVFAISSALILCVPRYYTSTVNMAPEMDATGTGGTLGSIASSLGFDLGEMQTSDAISPLLYPEVIESNDFIATLLDIPVKTVEGQEGQTYFKHMAFGYKKPFWTSLKNTIIGSVKRLFITEKETKNDGQINPFRLSKFESAVFAKIRESILCTVNKKTGVITITVRDQDPLIAATMADSVQSRLQEHIIKYRTSKARIDVKHYQTLTSQAKEDYDAAVARYSDYCDKHTGIILQSYISDRDKLETEMQTRLSTYSAMATQLETAKAKLQERTPAFTILQSPTVPNQAAGPKRMIFVIGMMILGSMAFVLWIARKELFSVIK